MATAADNVRRLTEENKELSERVRALGLQNEGFVDARKQAEARVCTVEKEYKQLNEQLTIVQPIASRVPALETDNKRQAEAIASLEGWLATAVTSIVRLREENKEIKELKERIRLLEVQNGSLVDARNAISHERDNALAGEHAARIREKDAEQIAMRARKELSTLKGALDYTNAIKFS